MAFIGKLLKANPRAPSGRWWHRPLPRAMPKARTGLPTPYRGYYYHILTRQGKNAPGGAKSYIVSGKMTEGFAFVAYPAEYRSSGVMTFIVSEDGVVYQKDLGTKTDVLAKAMKEYNPDSSWRKAEEQQDETAGEPQWQVGLITAVQPYQGPSSDLSATSYKVSLRVGNIRLYGGTHTAARHRCRAICDRSYPRRFNR